ncbi:mechanosensitive ion channel family protein [Marivirga arenosa]|uniref:Mechanosensitive ion channel n=1 Tax=Marivirga arenosa TaxID=3059076 RepID=A0AA51X3C0_9BACT|nr:MULTISPECIES: mechanosensitive ion channel domain-containing protein [unclassified Marivirga]WMN06838.1 mechanosensitive ion channel [Marivirga sp. ABR2-2]WNB16836.1 mechanosensitive ion channel [Marivirga sp. BKB1-2]
MSYFENEWQISPDLQLKIFHSFLALFVLLLIRFLALQLIFKNFKDVKDRYQWKNGVKNAYYIILLIALANIWIDKIDSIGTFLGLVSAGLAIALQVPIVNLAAWLFIVVRKPFEVGDRIEIGGVSGDVIDIRFFQFTINEIGNWVAAEQSTGRIIHVPNGEVFKVSQANYNQGFSHIWLELPVLVTFESNWRKAKEILENIINIHAEELSFSAKRKLLEASKKYMIFYSNLTPIVYTQVKDSGVELTIRFLSEPKKRRVVENNVWEAILDNFAKQDDIDFAYPTQRVFYNYTEGKEGAKKKFDPNLNQ